MQPSIRSFTLRSFVAAAAVIALAGRADAQVFDHLQCFKIKDATTKALYAANITASDPVFVAPDTACTIRVPAVFLCVDASKTNVTPVPPGAPDGPETQKYLCYKTKCAKQQPTATLTDQFGSHAVAVKKAGFVCAPVAPSCVDADLDGYCAGVDDCDDGDASVNPGAVEVCDGVDNDCNGTIDDGNPGGGQACTTGLPGVCAAGTTTCTDGALTCTQNQSASAEICDGLDNDCNGSVDEGNPGGGQACLTGQPGVCAAGTTTCTGGAMVCTQNQSASAEICDGLDNNCDGSVDEGNPGGGLACLTGQPGVCSAGTTTCTGGAMVCTQNQSASAEICDGLDNNCDGTIDEGCPP